MNTIVKGYKLMLTRAIFDGFVENFTLSKINLFISFVMNKYDILAQQKFSVIDSIKIQITLGKFLPKSSISPPCILPSFFPSRVITENIFMHSVISRAS